MPTTAVLIDTLIAMRQEAGDAPLEQFWKLMERFRADLVNQAFVILGNQEDAEDAAQETLSQAFVNLDQLRDPAKLGSWLRGINRNVSLNLRRRRARSGEERLATGQMNQLQARRTTTQSNALPSKNPSIVARAVDGLPEQFREVLVLRYWEKLSNDEIAQRLALPPGTVRSRMCRADRMLADKLQSLIQQENHPQ
jgi:RNA polymerase sigma-70 factor (ECF subfamily)